MKITWSRLALGVLLLACGAARTRAEEGAPEPGAHRTGPLLGFELEPKEADLLPDLAQDPEHPMVLRFVASWSEIERERGTYDWSALAPELLRLHQAGYRIVLCVTGSNPLYLPQGGPPSPLQGDTLDRWIDFVRSAVRTFGAALSVLEVSDAPAAKSADGAPGFDPDAYAFLLKRSALAARAEAHAANVELLVAEGALPAASLEWQTRLLEDDVAAYIDVLPIRVSADAGREALAKLPLQVLEAAAQHPPVPKIWMYVEPSDDPAQDPALTAIAAAGAGAEVALARAGGDAEAFVDLARVTYGLHRILGAGYAPAPPGTLAFKDMSGKDLAGPRVLGRFVNEEDLSTVIVYTGSAGTEPKMEAILALDVLDARDASVLDPRTGQTWTSAISAVNGHAAAGVLVTGHPMALRFKRVVQAGLDLPKEKLEVGGTRGLTAEEIIARHQQVERIQQDALLRWLARGRVTFHFKLAQGSGSVDVAMDCNYFWERGKPLEWEQVEYYINGNRVTWKKIPQLPLIQPEKVVTAPLDLTLDKTYHYRLAGEERVSERDAYVLEFEPAAASAAALYRGRVWIDKQSFVRLQLSVVQSGGLEAPVLANEEKSVYEPVSAAGKTFWMLTHARGEQLWTVAGRSFAVQREVDFSEFEINPEASELARRRQAAYASSHQILRDTEHGLRYLEAQPDGTRKVQESIPSSQIFAAGGVYKDSSISSVVPLAGFNYFNYDLGGKKIQANVFFAGVLVFATFSNPQLFGTKMDLTGEATGFALKRTDKLYLGAAEIEPQRVRFRSQNVSARIGFPLGSFFKLSLIGDVDFNTFFTDDTTDPAFVLPRDHQVLTGTLRAEFNRKGYGLTFFGSSSRRSDWEPWGIPDATGSFPGFDASQKSYENWGLSATKEWFLPKFQQLRASASYLDGKDLDRFSRSSFSYFGDTRLDGFSGTGIRFDRGAIARAGYGFNLFDVLRLGLDVGHARVEDVSSGAGAQDFTGVGVSGNFVGPWTTIISLGYGRAMASDIPDLVGKQEFFIAVFKLFAR